MKQTLLLAALGLATAGAAAQEIGRVLSATPVIQQVQVPRQVCGQPMVQAQPQTSGVGGIVGALIGAGIGSTIGHGGGTAAAMVAGTTLGAVIGNNAEADNQRYAQAAYPQCVTETSLENRTVAYNVTYEYAGRQFTTQMPYDPGPTIQLSVSPVSASATPGNPVVTAPPVAQGAPIVQSAPQVVQAAPPVVVQTVPAPVVYAAPYPAYPAYPAYPVYPSYYRPYPPVSLSLGFVFGGHRHHGGHRHFRHR